MSRWHSFPRSHRAPAASASWPGELGSEPSSPKVVTGPLESPPPMNDIRETHDRRIRAQALTSATKIAAAIIAANGPFNRDTEARITHHVRQLTDTYAHYLSTGQWPGDQPSQ